MQRYKTKSIGLFIFLIILTLSLPFSMRAVFAAPIGQEEAVYIVQQGDTLSSITLRFGISLEDLLLANAISDPNTVKIGQHLIIPGLEGISGILSSLALPYGSSLTGLTRQYGLNSTDIVFLNRITSPSEIIAGVKFIIPINEQDKLLVPLIRLQKSSTLIEAAIQTGTTPWSLINNNQLFANWDAIAGDTLYGNPAEGLSFTTFQEIRKLTFTELPFIQGETIQIEINTNTPLDLTGKIDNKEIHFVTEDGQTYYGFLGIHALADPGPYSFEITANFSDGSNQTFEQLVLISAGAYGDEWVNVPEEYLNEDDIVEEDSYLMPILTNVSSEKLWEGFFQYPVDEPLVNSSFGQRRNYNNGELFFYHTGMDFAVNAPNLNVYATAAGKVVLAEPLTIKGNAILIDHGWGVYSGYWHLSEFSVSVGDFVNAGDIIAQIGNTGRSAGPHLHFEIDIAGTPVNPQTWLGKEFPQQTP